MSAPINRKARTNPAEWQKGFWQADADLKTEGQNLSLYYAAHESFRAGYIARVNLK